MVAYLVREIGGMSLTDLGRRIKRDLSSLSAAAERLLSRSKVASDLEKRKQLLERALFSFFFYYRPRHYFIKPSILCRKMNLSIRGAANEYLPCLFL